MGIALLILKIIGIILLVIVGIAIVFALCLLFYPIRYKVTANRVKLGAKYKVKANWLLHIISFKISGQNAYNDISFKIFGIELLKDKKATSKNQTKETANIDNTDIADEAINKEEKAYEKIVTAKAPEKKFERVNKKRFYNFFKKIKNLPSKIKGFVNKIKYKSNEAYDIIKSKQEFIQSDRFKKVVNKLKKNVFTILRVVKPKKVRVDLDFGFTDSFYTGLVIAMISIIYPYTKDSIKVETSDKPKFYFDINAKGKFRTYRLIKPTLAIIKDKELKEVINELKER